MTHLPHSSRRLWAALGAGVGLLAIPPVFGEYWTYIATLACIHVLLAVGLNFVLGYAGQFSFGHSALYGFGAYATGLLMVRLNLPFVVAIVLAALAAIAVSLLIALPALRVSGVYLGIITVGFVELFIWGVNNWRDLTFGPAGFRVPIPTVAGLALNSSVRTYYLVLPVTIVLAVLARRLVRSSLGRALVAIRDNEVAARALGVDTTRYKLIAFGLNAGYAGVAGGLYAVHLNYLSPGTFGLFEAIAQFNMLVVGGVGTFYGPIIGALGVTVLFELLRGATGLQELLSGAFLVFFVLFLPHGVAGQLRRLGWLADERLRGGA